MSSSRTFISLLLPYKILDDDDISEIKKDASNEIGDIKFQSLDRYATTFHNVMDTTNKVIARSTLSRISVDGIDSPIIGITILLS